MAKYLFLTDLAKADANVGWRAGLLFFLSSSFDVSLERGLEVAFPDDKVRKPIPHRVLEELVSSFSLAQTSFMSFQHAPDRAVTASDASEKGGGLI